MNPPAEASSLRGLKVLVPRAAWQASALSDRIRARGGEVIEAPVLQIEPGDLDELRTAAHELAAGSYAAVCFTSPNGVRALAQTLATEQLDPAIVRLAGLIACVGSGTEGALQEALGLTADLVPPAATTLALAEVFPPGSGRVLLPRGDLANPSLPGLLRDKGYEPVDIVAYRTRRTERLPREVVQALHDREITHVVVGSPSTARNLITLVGDHQIHADLVSIGPVTTQACDELGLEVVAEADPHDLDGVILALEELAGRT